MDRLSSISRTRHPLALAAALALGTPAFGQSINIDCGANTTYPVPSLAYGAGASQAGTWNAAPALSTGLALVDVTGAASGATLTVTGAAEYAFNNAGTTGDDQNLLDDVYDVGGVGGVATLTVSGLSDGNYEIYTYTWAPDDRVGFCTDVDVAGSASGLQTVCGLWTGTHVQGTTYALHSVTVSGGSNVVITAATNVGFGSVNGVQIVPDAGGPSSYCAPGNANSVSAGGGVLASAGGYGTAGATFDITDVPNQPGLLFSGNSGLDLPFGCGRRCVGGFTIRGVPFTPSGNQALGVGFDMSAATSLNIQYWYRDPLNLATCGSAFNLTNALMP